MEKKNIKKAKRLATVAFHALTEETELWNPGAGVEFMRPLNHRPTPKEP